jgi:hypothetical protein
MRFYDHPHRGGYGAFAGEWCSADSLTHAHARMPTLSQLHGSNCQQITCRRYAASRISSTLRDSTKQFGWLQAPATNAIIGLRGIRIFDGGLKWSNKFEAQKTEAVNPTAFCC